MILLCPHCRREYTAPYYRLGLPVTCPNCHGVNVTMHSHVLSSEMTGYQVTFIDLGRLMQDFPTEVQAIITRRLGLQAVSVEIELARNAPVFLNAAGAVVPLEDVHERVQADQAAQYDLYQFAMSQWR